MKRIIQILIPVLLVFFVSSCQESDPAEVYGWSENPGIDGPRILTSVKSAGSTQAEYSSTSFGVLESVYVSASSELQNVYYNTSQRLNNIYINESTSSKITVNLSYGLDGNINTITEDQYDDNDLYKKTTTNITYNSAGKPINLIKLTKYPQTNSEWVKYTVVAITYDGLNVSKITENSAAIVSGVYDALDSANLITYTYDNYDNKYNPYSTLSKFYNITMGVRDTENFQKLSANNSFYQSKKVGSGALTETTTDTKKAVYDDQNFLVSTNSGAVKYSYKAIP